MSRFAMIAGLFCLMSAPAWSQEPIPEGKEKSGGAAGVPAWCVAYPYYVDGNETLYVCVLDEDGHCNPGHLAYWWGPTGHPCPDVCNSCTVFEITDTAISTEKSRRWVQVGAPHQLSKVLASREEITSTIPGRHPAPNSGEWEPANGLIFSHKVVAEVTYDKSKDPIRVVLSGMFLNGVNAKSPRPMKQFVFFGAECNNRVDVDVTIPARDVQILTPYTLSIAYNGIEYFVTTQTVTK